MTDWTPFTRTISVGMVLFTLFFTTIGCSSDVDTEKDERAKRNEPGLGVTISALHDSEVEGFRIDVETCTGDDVASATADLQGMTLPGGISAFEDKPFDADSAHAFADEFFVLDAGCYQVSTTPINAQGDRVDGCSTVEDRQVQIEDGQTREILLISQCEGEERGGLDVISAINHPPEIEDVVYTPSKFVACPQTVEICVEATDPDDDPLRATLDILSGPDPVTTPEVTEETTEDGSLRKCISFEPGGGQWTLEYTVWDQIHHNGELIDFEEYYELVQNEQRQSRDSIRFPLYGGGEQCDEVLPPVPDAGADVGVPPETGQPPQDTGVPPDTGQPSQDTGQPPQDTGQPPQDTGQPSQDTGQPPEDVGPDVGEDAGPQACTRTRGYWMTHHEDATAPGLQRDWPAPRDEDDLLCGETWLSILETPPEGNMWYILAAQWIAAELNVAAGASTPQEVDDALADAETILENNCQFIDPNSSLGQDAEDLKNTLDDYNNGLIGPGKCEDDGNGNGPPNGVPNRPPNGLGPDLPDNPGNAPPFSPGLQPGNGNGGG